MLNIGGELAFILKDINYSSKQELLQKLRDLRNGLSKYPKDERLKLRPILAVSLQQAFYTSEYELLNYKNFCDYRRNYGREENTKSSD